MEVTEKITLTNENNMDLMARYPDKFFDLAIVDPPYGSANIQGGYTSGKGGGVTRQKKYNQTLWTQEAPRTEYFNELFRVAKNVIVWGANHFIESVPVNSPCWIVWDKDNGEVSFADCELALTTFDTAARIFKYRWAGMIQQDMKNKEVRIHPTQKPVALYRWLLDKYAKPGFKILDTHLGSGSIAIACHDYGFELVASEIDLNHYNDTVTRVRNHSAQQKLFV